MPRSGSGSYTLPSGNPVVSGTTIETTWANTTLSDVGSALTDSLSRSGQGGMTAAFRSVDGTSSVPGVSFSNETTTGLYRAGSADLRLAVTTNQIQQWLTTGTSVTGTFAASGNVSLDGGSFTFNDSGADRDARFEGDTDANLLFTDASTDRVGVGTNTPSTKLHVVGDVTVSGTVNATTLDLTNIEVTNIKAKDGTASMTLADSTGVATLSANPILDAGTANAVAYLNASKVLTTGSTMQFDGTTLGIYNGTVDAQRLNLGTSGTNALINATRGSGTVPQMLFSIDGSEQMRLTSTGLGIGTSSPGAKLDVLGLASSIGLKVRGGGNSGINILDIADAGGSGPLVLNASGNLGIGTSSPDSKFQVETAPAKLRIGYNNTSENYYDADSQYFRSGAGAVRLTLDSSGNLGLGVTPSAWQSTRKALQVGSSSSLHNVSNNTFVGNNFYSDGTSRYLTTGVAGLYGQESDGAHKWYTAPSGTAGNAISFTQAMTLDASGRLGIGRTSMTYPLDVQAADGNGIRFTDTNNSVQSFMGAVSSAGVFGTLSNHSTTFWTNNAERARITSAGDLLVGATSGTGKLYVESTSGVQILARNPSASGYASLRLYNDQNSNVRALEIDYFGSTASGGERAEITTTGAYPLLFLTNNTERARIDSSGNLGVGTASPADAQLTTVVSVNNASGYCGFRVLTNGTAVGRIVGNAGTEFRVDSLSTNPLTFYTNGSERARIDSSGNLLVGTTGSNGERLRVTCAANNQAIYAENTNATANGTIGGVYINYTGAAPNSTGFDFLRGDDTGANRFAMRSNGGLANYSGNDVNLSDRREKTNFAPAKSYLDTICAIPVQTFEYIDQSEDDPGLTLGVVAQDVQAVAPELVMESNWGTEDNPKMRLSVYQTDLQYALMKCIQELKAQNDELRARVAALEAA